MKISYTPSARKDMRKIPQKMAYRIAAAIEKLAGDPGRRDLDTKKLVNREGFRLRVGDWRVIYTEDGFILSILHVKSRGSVYK